MTIYGPFAMFPVTITSYQIAFFVYIMSMHVFAPSEFNALYYGVILQWLLYSCNCWWQKLKVLFCSVFHATIGQFASILTKIKFYEGKKCMPLKTVFTLKRGAPGIFQTCNTVNPALDFSQTKCSIFYAPRYSHPAVKGSGLCNAKYAIQLYLIQTEK